MDASLEPHELIHAWRPAQVERLAASGLPRAVDIHCHCLPAIDDGPVSLEESLALCDALVEDGLTTIIATPHQLGPYDRTNSAARIRTQVTELNQELASNQIPLEVLPGADVRIDERLTRLLAADEVMTVADRGQYILLELPFHQFVDPLPLIGELHTMGIVAVMTHPERHDYLRKSMRTIQGWHEAGAVVQVTAGSLLGYFGQSAEAVSWQLLRANLVGVVATDAHDSLKRFPPMSAAIEAISLELDRTRAFNLCVQNPWRILQGEQIISL